MGKSPLQIQSFRFRSHPKLLSNHRYVLLAATSTFILNALHAVNTGRYRNAAKVEYPLAYAPSSRTDAAAVQFNSAQRAHGNYIENQPSMLGALLFAGIYFPLTAAAMGLGWSVCRWLYMKGYSEGQQRGKGRHKGIFYLLFQVGLTGLAAWNGVAMIRGWY